MQISLKDEVIGLLNQRRGKWRKICRETGLDYSWLSKLMQDKIDDPGVKKLEVLMSYFHDDKV